MNIVKSTDEADFLNAAHCLNEDGFKYGLTVGVDINTRNKGFGSTALMISCQLGGLKCVKFLIEHGADVNLINDQGYTALAKACDSDSRNNIEIASILLQANCSTEMPLFKDKFTPLMFAAKAGNGDMVRLLMSHGANVLAKDSINWTALDHARSWGRLSAVSILEVFEENQKIINQVSAEVNQSLPKAKLRRI